MKARSDSVLKSRAEQSEEFGEKVSAWITTPKSKKCAGGYQYAQAQLAADGIKTSIGALSEFYSWWQLRKTFQHADSLATQIEELATKTFPNIDPQKITEFGQLLFTLQAANARNAEEFREMEYLKLAKETSTTRGRQKEEELQLKKNKFQRDTAGLFIKWAADEKAKQILAGGGTRSEKINALGQVMFPDWDES